MSKLLILLKPRILLLALAILSLLAALLACGSDPTATRNPTRTPTPPPQRALSAPANTPTPRPTVAIPFTDDTETAALIALFRATDGDNWDDNANWLSAASIGEWAGVTTNSSGSVTELDLSDNNLTGTLPPDLAELDDLEVLLLHDNQLSGVLPAELANLDSLNEVSIWGNQLTWAPSYAPGVLADMVALTALYQDTNGGNWTDNTNWLTTEPLDEWFGITADAGGRVTELSLANNELKPQSTEGMSVAAW